MASKGSFAESATSSNLVTVGEIAGAYGIKGWVKIKSFTQPQENILNYSPWWLKTRHGVKRVEVDTSMHRPQGVVAHIVDLDDRDQAAALVGVKIAIERDQLPALEEGDYYWDQLIGLAVVSEYESRNVALGRITGLLETGANDVLVVKGDADSLDTRERLIPYLPGSVVCSIDLERSLVTVDWDPDF